MNVKGSGIKIDRCRLEWSNTPESPHNDARTEVDVLYVDGTVPTASQKIEQEHGRRSSPLITVDV